MIPRSFKLGGRKWAVVMKTQKQFNRMCEKAGLPVASGLCSYSQGKIFLSSDDSPEIQDISFEHELIHAIWFTQGKTDHDEVEVDGEAHLRHQFNKTARYKE